MSIVTTIRSRRGGDRNLTQRAGLTAVATLIRQSARVLVAILIVPIVLHSIGVEQYGIWLVVQQSVGLLVVADLRATGTLKSTLAITQHDSDLGAKRRQIGASMTFWAMTLPIVVLVTLLAGFLLPYVVDVPADLVETTRIVFLITMAGVILDRLLSMPGLVLRGMNLDYVGMGIDAFMLLFGGLLGLLAVEAGLGLIGFVTASMAGVLLGDVVRGIVAWRRLPWMGFERPTRDELRQFAGHSGWLALGDVSGLLLFGTELILVGAVAGATAAAIYGSTQFVIRTVCGPLVELVSSAAPGIAKLVGEGMHERALQIREHLLVLGLSGAVAVGAAVLVVNRAFVDVWVGSRLYGGASLNAVLVALAVVTVLIRLDMIVVDVCLGFRGRSTLSLCGAVVGLAAGAAFGLAWGPVGAASGLLVGRCVVLVVLPRLLARATRSQLHEIVRPMIRPVAAAAVVLTGAGVVGTVVQPPVSWVSVVVVGALTAVVAAALFVLLGATAEIRRDLVGRLWSLAGRPRHDDSDAADADVDDGLAGWMSEARPA
jgi:O-antigen/teichoic acid export membrane protein